MAATKERLTISIDARVKADLERLVPKNKRSNFVEMALKEALDQAARDRAITAIDAIKPVKMPDGLTTEQVLREMRDGVEDTFTERDSEAA